MSALLFTVFQDLVKCLAQNRFSVLEGRNIGKLGGKKKDGGGKGGKEQREGGKKEGGKKGKGRKDPLHSITT